MSTIHPPAGSAAASAPAPTRPTRTLVLGAAVLAVVAGVLWWTGHALPGPDTYDHQGFVQWLTTTDPIVAAFAVVRLVGLGLITWTAATGVLGLVVHRSPLRRRRRLVGFVDRLCLPAVRRLVHTAAGVALATATLAPGAAAAATGEPARQVATVMVLPDRPVADTAVAATPSTTGPSATGPATTGPSATGPTERAVVMALDDIPPGIGSDLPSTDPAPAEPAPTPADPEATPARPTDPQATWRIQPGEHLWHVATAVLTDHLARPPADQEVATYLTALVETNRDRLVVPSDPDLVMVGQVFDLPDPSTTTR
ncbi:hypothetical protein [Rhabdothermincola salaria]|uniref:hypothetical protein n=1 Tax=Rhabdothermincola salaria TaxID=2903142 RepID=UPI001E6501EA|nr:hypothetical protein [Rhabdothermincola salaria]MCD9622690.1 hypothetical protein [Rhabdothermincola salaria]